MSTLYFFFATLLSLFFPFTQVAAFTFTFGTVSQCDDLSLSWTGGTQPFQLLIIPVFGTPRNISIPNTAFSNGKGTFSTQLAIAKDQEIVLTMSDATGFNSGGSTNVLTVQASKGGSCNTTDPGIAYPFQLNTALQQCRPFTFSGYTGAVQPVTIGVVVPGGTAFTLAPPFGPTDFSWNTNVARGTSLIFFMVDSQGRQGGSSDVRIVSSSDDTSCLNAQSPSSTSNPPSSSQTTTLSNSSTSSPSSSSTPKADGISMGAIAGTVIGGLLFMAVIVTLGLFCLKKKRDNRSSHVIRRNSRAVDSDIDLTYDPSQAPVVTPYGLPPPNAASLYPQTPNSSRQFGGSDPFLDNHAASQYQPSTYPASTRYQPSTYRSSGQYESSEQETYLPYAQAYPPQQNYPPPRAGAPSSAPVSSGDEFDPYASAAGQTTSRDSMSTAPRTGKAALASMQTYTPSRFIMHTDADDVLPPPNEDGVVELPPQYTERRGPLGVTNPTQPYSASALRPP